MNIFVDQSHMCLLHLSPVHCSGFACKKPHCSAPHHLQCISRCISSNVIKQALLDLFVLCTRHVDNLIIAKVFWLLLSRQLSASRLVVCWNLSVPDRFNPQTVHVRPVLARASVTAYLAPTLAKLCQHMPAYASYACYRRDCPSVWEVQCCEQGSPGRF